MHAFGPSAHAFDPSLRERKKIIIIINVLPVIRIERISPARIHMPRWHHLKGLYDRTGPMAREDIDPRILALCDEVTAKRARALIDYLIEHGECSTEDLNDLGHDHPPRVAGA